MRFKLFLLFNLVFLSVSFADQAKIEVTSKSKSETETRRTKVLNDHGVMFISIETRAAGEGELIKFTEMFFFDGSVVAIFSCDFENNLKFTQVKHDSPVAVTVEDLDGDGIIDRVVYSRDDAGDSFFSKSTKAFFRNEKLGMIPVVGEIYDSHGVAYQIDRGTETIHIIEGK